MYCDKYAASVDRQSTRRAVHCSGTGPAYLADELRHSSEFVSRRRLRSASSFNLIVRRTRLSTYGDRAFSVAGPCLEQSSTSRHFCVVS